MEATLIVRERFSRGRRGRRTHVRLGDEVSDDGGGGLEDDLGLREEGTDVGGRGAEGRSLGGGPVDVLALCATGHGLRVESVSD